MLLNDINDLPPPLRFRTARRKAVNCLRVDSCIFSCCFDAGGRKADAASGDPWSRQLEHHRTGRLCAPDACDPPPTPSYKCSSWISFYKCMGIIIRTGRRVLSVTGCVTMQILGDGRNGKSCRLRQALVIDHVYCQLVDCMHTISFVRRRQCVPLLAHIYRCQLL